MTRSSSSKESGIPMPSQLPASEPGRRIIHCDTAIPFPGRAIMRRLEDPDLTEGLAAAQAQRIWTTERAKHSTG